MSKENEPLMFIQSVLKQNGNNGQMVFDSRKDNKKERGKKANLEEDTTILEADLKDESDESNNEEIIENEEGSNNINLKEVQKIEQMVKLYENNRIVICRIETNNKIIECIPVKINENKVVVKQADLTLSDIDIKNIKKVEIVHI